MCSRLFFGLVVLFSVVSTAVSQEYIYDTSYVPRYVKCFKIPATFNDYHVDGSSPDFGYRVTSRWDQSKQDYGNKSGWVDSTLSADGFLKRAPALADPFFDISWNIAKLFRPWTPGVTDTFVMKFPPIVTDTTIDTIIVNIDTTYDVDSVPTVWIDTTTYFTRYDTTPVPDTLMISDTMFKNMEINDSIAAYWLPNDATYEDTTDSLWVFGSQSKFDPLAGKGYGVEDDSTQNAGYTMRFHNRITYKGGEQIEFGADDDAYLFINGKLAIECGGFHNANPILLELDSLLLADGTHLVPGEKYMIDIFFVERRQGGGYYITGLTEFENRSLIQIDTVYDTIINATEGINPRSVKYTTQSKPLFGQYVPLSTERVTMEYFSMSGAKVYEKNMSLTQARSGVASENLSGGMYLLRITFLNEKGRRLSRSSFRKAIVKQ